MRAWLHKVRTYIEAFIAVVILIVVVPHMLYLIAKYEPIEWAKLTRHRKILLVGMAVWFYAMLGVLVYLIASAIWGFLA